MKVWAIFFNPRDAPGKYVVRVFVNAVPGIAFVESSLEAARDRLPPDLVMLAPMPGDDPTVVETWI